jgi:hypothetical protein
VAPGNSGAAQATLRSYRSFSGQQIDWWLLKVDNAPGTAIGAGARGIERGRRGRPAWYRTPRITLWEATAHFPASRLTGGFSKSITREVRRPALVRGASGAVARRGDGRWRPAHRARAARSPGVVAGSDGAVARRGAGLGGDALCGGARWLCRRWPCGATLTLRSHQSSFGAKSERWLLKVDDVREPGRRGRCDASRGIPSACLLAITAGPSA